MDKYNKNGLVGLYNLGNTCFLNSCLQIINHIYELNIFLDTNNTYNNNNESLLLKEWNNLRNVMWSGNGIVKPHRFLHHLQIVSKSLNYNMFSSCEQNDISEFLIFFMECIHKGLCKKIGVNVKKQLNNIDTKCYELIKTTYEKEYSEIMDIFYGVSISHIYNMNNKLESTTPEMFFSIDLPIFDNNEIFDNIYNCFDHYTKDEHLTGDNAWYNEETNSHQDAKKKMVFWKLPKILIITFKRFNYNLRKIQKKIQFPIQDLDLKQDVVTNDNCKYDCFGICNHSGNVGGGHYTAFVKNALGNWHLFNDANISKVKNEASLVTEQAYCLFYRKK